MDLSKGREGVFSFMRDVDETNIQESNALAAHHIFRPAPVCLYLSLGTGDRGPFIIADTSVNVNVNANTSDTSLYEEHVAYHSHQHDTT